MPIRYIIQSRVVKVEEKFLITHTAKDGTQTKVPLGWFLTLEGSYESLCVGSIEPELRTGDKMRITIEKET